MPKDEIQCDRCQEVLHYTEYSKSQRKQEDPVSLSSTPSPQPALDPHRLWAGRSCYCQEYSLTLSQMCMRCVAWGETQHHGVTPAPLATGHVSIEETTGEVWAGRSYLTDEDYCRPQVCRGYTLRFSLKYSY